jgi:hypothetical protein
VRSLGATSGDLQRNPACVGFCVALGSKSAYSSGKTRLFSVLLGELSPRGVAPARMEPQRRQRTVDPRRFRSRHRGPCSPAHANPRTAIAHDLCAAAIRHRRVPRR